MAFTVEEQLAVCQEKGLLTAEEVEKVAAYDTMRRDALLTDAFNKDWSKVMPVWQAHTVASNKAEAA